MEAEEGQKRRMGMEKMKEEEKNRGKEGEKRGKEKEGRRREGPVFFWSKILTYSVLKELLEHTFLISLPNDDLSHEAHRLYLDNVGGEEMGNRQSWGFLRGEGNYTFRKNNFLGYNYAN